ncbi:MAG: polysaccharide biosynthesis protein [Geminicoccaceae bacterium]
MIGTRSEQERMVDRFGIRAAFRRFVRQFGGVGLPASPRQLGVFLHDIILASFSLVFAFFLRLNNDDLTPERLKALIFGVPIFTVIAGITLLMFDVYRDIWRFTSIRGLFNIMKASTLAVLVFCAVSWAIDRGEDIPRSVPMIQWFILIVMLGAPRFVTRLLVQQRSQLRTDTGIARIPIVVVGADEHAALFLRALEQDRQSLYHAVGILDLTSDERGRKLHEVPVFGAANELMGAFKELDRRRLRPKRLVLTKPLDSDIMRTLLETAERLNLTICRLPSLTEFKEATADGHIELRPVAVEELLGRPEALLHLDHAAIASLIEGRRVLVTGAGGSIGSELVRQIARLRPARLVLVDSGELNLYTIDYETNDNAPYLSRRSVLCNVRDRDVVMRLFDEERPELVFHAAALKHVPLVELNPTEGIRTNVIGTRNIADAALQYGAMAFVEVSSDKAVNPTNVMGASKRLAELYVQALDVSQIGAKRRGSESNSDQPRTRFMTVRFGNVLGSSGSVIPLFERQLERGGPITITHPEIERYFMTIREAVELILQASAHSVGQDDERGLIFVLDMGKPIRIMDVARQMIRLSGLDPDRDVKISIVGLRPGEKLFEELFDASERRLPAVTAGVFGAASKPIPLDRVIQGLDTLSDAADRNDMSTVCAVLEDLIPGYRQSGEMATAAISSAGKAPVLAFAQSGAM